MIETEELTGDWEAADYDPEELADWFDSQEDSHGRPMLNVFTTFEEDVDL